MRLGNSNNNDNYVIERNVRRVNTIMIPNSVALDKSNTFLISFLRLFLYVLFGV